MKTTLLLLSILIMTGCNFQNTNTTPPAETKNIRTTETLPMTEDKQTYTVLPFNPDQPWPFESGSTTNLADEELLQIEKLLAPYIEEYNITQQEHFEGLVAKYPEGDFDIKDYVIDLTQYRRQYLPVINTNNQKEVWVNCFCSNSFPEWRTNLLFVSDGGNCFFQLKINLDKNTLYDFSVNGEA